MLDESGGECGLTGFDRINAGDLFQGRIMCSAWMDMDCSVGT